MKRTLFYVTLALVSLYCLGPFLWQLLTSLKPDEDLTSLPPLLPRRLTLSHYRTVFLEQPFLRIMGNSLVVASLSTLLSVSLGALAAFALARTEIRGKVLVLGAALSISMFPPIAIVSPLYLLIRALHLRDSWWALILTHTAFTLPLSIWILTNFFREIPEEILKAARVDGCSTFQLFSKIVLPLAVPGLFTAAILVFIFSWNEFLFALTFTATEASRTVPVGIALFPGVHEIPWGEIAAASIVVTLPLVGLVFAFQKRIVQGLTAGAVKG